MAIVLRTDASAVDFVFNSAFGLERWWGLTERTQSSRSLGGGLLGAISPF